MSSAIINHLPNTFCEIKQEPIDHSSSTLIIHEIKIEEFETEDEDFKIKEEPCDDDYVPKFSIKFEACESINKQILKRKSNGTLTSEAKKLKIEDDDGNLFIKQEPEEHFDLKLEDDQVDVNLVLHDHSYFKSDDNRYDKFIKMSQKLKGNDEKYYSTESSDDDDIQDITNSSSDVEAIDYEEVKINHEDSKILKCPQCPMIFEDTLRLNRHKRLHQAPQHQCRNCFKKFKRKTSLKKHHCDLKCPICTTETCTCRMDVDTSECRICQKIDFRYFEDYKQHMMKHNEIVICKICERNKFTLFKHKQQGHTMIKYFKCTICTSVLRSKESLTSHMEIHGKNFACQQCDKKFSRRYLLKQHELVHETPNLHHCSICNKNFQRKFCLDNHRRNIHGDKNKEDKYLQLQREIYMNKTESSKNWLSCKRCPALFRNKESIQKHMDQAHSIHSSLDKIMNNNKLRE